jgi:hypothetical protein
MCAWMLAGCVPPPANVIPTSVPTAAPVFASEDEALAAAVKAYEGYLAVSDRITAAGGRELEPLSALVTSDFLPQVLDSFKPYASGGLRTKGSTTFDNPSLQRYTQLAAGKAVVGIYGCLDLTQVRVLDAAGKDVTSQTRTNRLPLEIELQTRAANDPTLILSRSNVWMGKNFCGP